MFLTYNKTCLTYNSLSKDHLMSISEKMTALRKRREDLKLELPDFRFRVQTAYRIPLALRRALERMKNQTNKTLGDLIFDAIINKCKDEEIQIKPCPNIERKYKNIIFCNLYKKEITVDNCIKCSVPYGS